MPQRPWLRSCDTIEANFTRFSPATPMAIAPARVSFPIMRDCAACVSAPQSFDALLMRTVSPSISRYTGRFERPRTTIPSHPARLRLIPKLPPLFEWPIAPVSGLFAEMSYRLEHGAPVPVRGDVITTSTFSGESGSIPGCTMSQRILVLRKRPPMKRSRSASLTEYSPILPFDKSTSIILPMYPLKALAMCIHLVFA